MHFPDNSQQYFELRQLTPGASYFLRVMRDSTANTSNNSVTHHTTQLSVFISGKAIPELLKLRHSTEPVAR
jgi:hypothetical protein